MRSTAAKAILLASALAAPGCSLFRSTPDRAAAPAADANAMSSDMEVKAQGEQIVRSYDLNRDKKPDDWKYFKLVPDPSDPGKRVEVLQRRELDSNFDGNVDIWTWYNDDGTKSKEQYDLDFDGKIDVVDIYDHGVITRKESFHGFSGKPDQVTFYENGKKVRVERDTKGEGRVDTWEYYENDKLMRIGQDLDGDGVIDRWVKAKEEEEEAPAAAPAAGKKSAAAEAPPAQPQPKK